ncbi:ROK family transcriptional regulator [Panacibacter ginsenosidivorans]|uniref:ROK family transcriptional regulator n=1 Tax=Panacibacter ginsenosidivorans TaxID=1813871 RepID=A0A5B8VA07_9BACT|nr:ROK family transcriptional regulator [Panacibacter ginsenosidivorans]QEC68317.1 ROK family transcriptional regulator [Panacibacter ginsenosidivorans]
MKEMVAQQDKFDFQSNLSKIAVLRLIRNEKKITRAKILQQTGLSAPTLTRIIESLVQMNLLQTDSKGLSGGGRPPQLVRFNSKENYVIGIDIDASFIRAVLSNLAGEFIFEIHIPTNFKDGFDEVMTQVGGLIGKLVDRVRQKKLRLWGIGIAVSGMVNKSSGIIEYSPIFNWRNVNIREALSKYTDLEIALGNVVDLVAVGELLYGVGRQYANFICLNLGYGIGAGIILDRKLFSGADGFAGEIGHVVVDKNSTRKGMEGVTGTLEALASGYGIAEIAQAQAPLYNKSILHKLEAGKIDAALVFESARKADPLAIEIVNNATAYIGIGIDTLIKLFNTECVVLYGELIEYEPQLIEKISRQWDQYSMKAISRKVPVLSSSFGENAALIGSFSLILEKILQLEISLPGMPD